MNASPPRPRTPSVGLVGYGRMGQTLHRLAVDAGLDVRCIVAPRSPEATHPTLEAVTPAEAPEVWIDFSTPDAVWAHLEHYAAGGIPAVVGTTGWTDRLPEAQSLFADATAPTVWAGNFSLGVTLFLRLVEQAAALFGQVDGYDPAVTEVHHQFKADSPSGTALHVADAVQSGWSRPLAVVTDRLDRPRAAGELHVSSTRVGHVPGTHTVWFDSPADTVELTHTARTREGFANGALQAARWLVDGPPPPGLWRFDDLVTHRLATVGDGAQPHRIGTDPTQEDA